MNFIRYKNSFILIKMGVGLFRKIGDFFKKTWKKVKEKVFPVVKKVWQYAKPALQTVAPLIPTVGPVLQKVIGGIDTGMNVADGVVNATTPAQAVKHAVSPFIKLKKNNAVS